MDLQSSSIHDFLGKIQEIIDHLRKIHNNARNNGRYGSSRFISLSYLGDLYKISREVKRSDEKQS
jgi:hypothetical protein